MSNSNTVAIVGCGLLGSMLSRPLSAYAVSLEVDTEIMLVDYDKVEKRNSPSDLGVPGTIGDLKVDVVAKVFESAGIVVNKQAVRVTKKNLWLFKKVDLIVGALDNVESRGLLLEASKMYNVPYIDLGLSLVGGNVTWSHGDVQTMPFSTNTGYKPDQDKKPACELVATRIYSAIAVECAVMSIFILTSGHDPASVVYSAIGRQAQQGDLINWYISTGDSTVRTTAKYVGSVSEVDDDSTTGAE